MYFIIENQKRADGIVNTSTITRQSFASGLSYFYERCSKMVVNTEFPSVAIMLVDEDLNIIEHKVIETQYEAPTE